MSSVETINCPRFSSYGRWNNTSTNLKIKDIMEIILVINPSL